MVLIFQTAPALLIGTAVLMTIFSIAAVMAGVKRRIHWYLAAYLIGSFAGLPLYLSNWIKAFGFTPNESGTLLGWLMQCAASWIGCWLPFGTAGLLIALACRRISGKPLSEDLQGEKKDSSWTAIKFMTVVSGLLWLVVAIGCLRAFKF